MDRRQSASTWPLAAWALALTFATAHSSRAQDPPPVPPARPTAPGVDPKDIGGAAPAPLAPVDALPAPGRSTDPAARRTAMPDPDPDPDEKNPLPLAGDRPGAPAAAGGPKADGPVDGYNIPANLPSGRQAAGLSLEVVAPEVMNKGQTKTVKIVVRNTGVADVLAVRVYYNMPKELEFASAQPEATPSPAEPGRYSWTLNTVAAGSEQVIALKVKPMHVGTIDHNSSVTLMVGARAHTSIQEPMLRVEQTVSPAKVLRGQQVVFRISVSNPGSGPARNVIVRAKLSSGLRTASGDEVVEQTIPVLRAQEHVELDPLEADTIAGGEQTCTVTAESDDVTRGPAENKVVRAVTVLTPKLELALQGPQTRYTDMQADYTINVANPGTAAAKNVRVSITLPPSGGKLLKPYPAGTEWNPATQKLSWVIPNLEPTPAGGPGKNATTIHVRLGGVGSYRVAADAKAGDLFASDAVVTSISGMADLDVDVDEKKRVLDMGETTVFDITIKNLGTKEAKNILVSAILSPNVKVDITAGTDADASYDDKAYDKGEPYRVQFPPVESIPARGELKLSIRVEATKPGTATCRVRVLHEDLKETDALEAIRSARVTRDARSR